MTNLIIREIDADVLKIVGVAKLRRLVSHLTDPPFDEHRIDVEPAVRSEHCRVIGIFQADELFGIITVSVYDTVSGRHAWLEDLVVDPSARGRGIGYALTEAAVGIARRSDAVKVSSTVGLHRTGSHAIHGRLGFEAQDSTLYVLRLTDG